MHTIHCIFMGCQKCKSRSNICIWLLRSWQGGNTSVCLLHLNYDNIEKVHLCSDGPPSQFKQKYLFSIWNIGRGILISNAVAFLCYLTWKRSGRWYWWFSERVCTLQDTFRRVVQTAKQVAEVAQVFHTNFVIKYVSANGNP